MDLSGPSLAPTPSVASRGSPIAVDSPSRSLGTPMEIGAARLDKVGSLPVPTPPIEVLTPEARARALNTLNRAKARGRGRG